MLRGFHLAVELSLHRLSSAVVCRLFPSGQHNRTVVMVIVCQIVGEQTELAIAVVTEARLPQVPPRSFRGSSCGLWGQVIYASLRAYTKCCLNDRGLIVPVPEKNRRINRNHKTLYLAGRRLY